MIIRVGYNIVFELPAPTPMVVLLNLPAHPAAPIWPSPTGS